MRTFIKTRRVSGVMLIIAAIIAVVVTACDQNGGLLDPLASSTIQTTGTSSVSAQSDQMPEMADIIAHGGALRELEGITPDAILSLHRVGSRPGATTTVVGGAASARFASTATVSGVSVSVNGASFTLTALSRTSGDRPGGHGGPGGGHPRGPGGGAPPAGVGLSTAFVYPAPPASKETTPTFIPMPEGHVTATFSATGYTLSPSTVSVPGIVTVSSHKSGDAVSRSSNLTVRWSVSGDITSGVVVIHPARDTSNKPVGRPANPGNGQQKPTPVMKTISAGATSVEFTAADLANIQAGNVIVEIMVANVNVSSDKKVAAIGRSGARLPLVLQ